MILRLLGVASVDCVGVGGRSVGFGVDAVRTGVELVVCVGAIVEDVGSLSTVMVVVARG